nr:hypothetical protein Iba_chr14bCG12410 [Ipomoea batatas]
MFISNQRQHCSKERTNIPFVSSNREDEQTSSSQGYSPLEKTNGLFVSSIGEAEVFDNEKNDFRGEEDKMMAQHALMQETRQQAAAKHKA